MAELISNGVRLHYEMMGEGDPVLLIPGTAMPPAVFQFELAPALIDLGYQVVAIGNRGLHPSDAPPAPYLVSDMAVDAIGVIDALELGACHVVGYSLGGFIAEELSYQRPELVRDVVLIASAGHATAFFRAYIQAEVDLAETLDPPLASQVARDTLLLVHSVDVLQNDDHTVELMTAMLNGTPAWTNPGRLGQWSVNLAWLDDERRTERWARLRHRCLAIAFEHDILWPPSRVHEAAQAMPNAQFEVVAGAAHGGLLTHGSVVTSLVAEFLNES